MYRYGNCPFTPPSVSSSALTYSDIITLINGNLQSGGGGVLAALLTIHLET